MHQILNGKLVISVISRISFIITAALMVSAGVAVLYSENISPFLYPSVISGFTGLAFFFISKSKQEEGLVSRKEAFFSVTLSWLWISLVGSIPFLVSGSIPSFTDAFFESVSGFTTTGSSILTDIEVLPKSVLFWRSMTHWIGGIGIIVLFIIVMPSLHEGGYHLFTLESSLQEKIQPRIRSVGQRLALIYVTLTVAEVILLLAGGMNLFESVCHAFGTVATGGFSPKNNSIAGYSAYIQYVIMIFMLLSGTNYMIHYYLVKKSFSKIKTNGEVKFYYLVVFIIGAGITLGLVLANGKPLEDAFRESFFQVISIVTCTGFATADYLLWPSFAWVLLFFAMFLGGSTGSTAGGIKMARHLLVIKNIKRFFRESFHRNAVVPLKLNGNAISEAENKSILSYVSTYLIVFVLGFIALMFTGLDGQTAASAAATTMAGIGPGLGTVGPVANFAHLSSFAKFILAFLMILGRLEIYTVLILFTRNFWKE